MAGLIEQVDGYDVEFTFDTKAGNWHFRVETPAVIGGGQKTLAATIRAASRAIAFALEPLPGVKQDMELLKGKDDAPVS